MKTRKVGDYYYVVYRNQAVVFRVDEIKGNFIGSSKISTHETRDAARNEVYRLNGWKKKM